MVDFGEVQDINAAYPVYLFRELVDPTAIIGIEDVVDTLSVVPWAHYEEWLSDLDMTAFYPEDGEAKVNMRP